MKINPKMLEKLLAMDDDALWNIVKATAKQSGIEPEKLQRPSDMTPIRQSLSQINSLRLGDVQDLLKGLKNG